MAHIKDSVPQKGLNYSIAPEDENTLVLVGYVKDEKHWNAILKNKIYNVRAGMVSGSLRLIPGFEHSKYALLYDSNGRKALYALSESGPRLVSKEELVKKKFDVGHEFYLCFDFRDDKPIVEFTDPKSGRIMKVRKNLNPRKKEPYFTTMRELLEK